MLQSKEKPVSRKLLAHIKKPQALLENLPPVSIQIVYIYGGRIKYTKQLIISYA